MLQVLLYPGFRLLLTAQVWALIGTGLATVAIAIEAFSLAGDNAGFVLGTAMAIRVAAPIVVAPIAAALADGMPTRMLLTALDLFRAVMALCLLFVAEVWHAYVIIFLMQAASAVSTPLIQAAIPVILPKDEDYTAALAFSRAAFDLEKVLSPIVAALLLIVIPYKWLYYAASTCFFSSAICIVLVSIPAVPRTTARNFFERTTFGIRTILKTPSLKGLLAFSFCAATGGSMVVVNTVVLVQGAFELKASHTAFALATFGLGSTVAALSTPGLLKAVSDRTLILAGSVTVLFGLTMGLLATGYSTLLPSWLLIGAGYSLVLTPAGRVLRYAVTSSELPLLLGANFALSHICWLITYLAAGWLSSSFGYTETFAALLGVAGLATACALRLWRRP